ncbi:MAG: trigger factor [Hyphomicrobiaceae bacterium]
MQITETNSDGLKRQLRVVIGAGEIGERFKARLDEIKGSVQLKGFRKGMVPETHLKKLFGRSMMAETLQQMVDESSRKALSERNERPAMTPQIELAKEGNEIDKVIDGDADLAFDMSFEILPEIKFADFSSLNLTRMTAEVEDKAIDDALAALAERNTNYEAEEGRAGENGDRITIDFVGKIGGEPFENGSGEDVPIVLGQSRFIPGFEEGLIGAKAGEERQLNVTFPEAYQVETLKGQAATFDVKVKEVAKPVRPAIDEDFAKGLGAESLENLRELVKSQIQREYDQASRQKLKRALLDALDTTHDFALPPSLVDAELEGIMQQMKRSLESSGRTFEDEGKTEEEARAEYRKIAERRVRLGLLIGEIGEKNKIDVSQEELRAALIQQARQFTGQERMVLEYYEKNPQAVAELRAPIFEDKVVDFLLELAKPAERKVTREELLAPEEEELPNQPAAG